MDKFLNYYRIPSARAYWSEYNLPGTYFITICTAFRESSLGIIENDRIQLSRLGEIVLQEWKKSFVIREELSCDIVVIMPNHIHAILRIAENPKEVSSSLYVETHCRASPHGSASLHNKTGIAYRPPKSISSFVAGFKSSATRQINEYRKTPGIPVWQTRFHDRIIRDEPEYQKIYWYIRNNIRNWKEDNYYR